MDHVREQWLIFSMAGNYFAVNIEVVKEMVQLYRATPIPNTPDYILGTMRLRDRIIALIDLRIFLGMESMEMEKQALIELMDQRERDHVLWLDELHAAVNERRSFDLARDPHQCAFGKWYDNYKTNDRIMTAQLKKFDRPHKAIHAIADRVLAHRSKNEHEQARAVIESTRKRELAEMIEMFGQIRETISNRNNRVAIILEREADLVGLVVDEILSVAKIGPKDVQPPPVRNWGAYHSAITGITQHQSSGDKLILVLDGGYFLHEMKESRPRETSEAPGSIIG